VAPVLSASINAVTGANGWYNAVGKATVTYSVVEAGSGAAIPAPYVFGDGSNQSLAAVTVTDAAGNVSNSAGTFSGINQDTAAPTVSASPISGPATTGWYNIATGGPVIHFTAADGGSGVSTSTVPADRTLTDQGTNVGTSATIYDVAGNRAMASISGLKVDTVAPALGAIAITQAGQAVTSSPIAYSSTATYAASSTFGDSTSGFGGSSWNWDTTGSTMMRPGTGPTAGAAGGTLSDSYQYSGPGVYTVTLTTDDQAGNHTEQGFKYVVLYDTTAGFVTGGGTVNVPAGSYTVNPALSGPANFGFVAKYQKGSNTPTGNTEFNFQVGSLRFKGTSYDTGSLVVSAARATYKGTGTINGAGNYKFMLVAIDDQINGGGGYDRLRMKIIDNNSTSPTNGQVIFDNQINTDDNAALSDSTIVTADSSIVIHKALEALGGPGTGAATAEPLTQRALMAAVDEAAARWQAAGIDPAKSDALKSVEVRIVDLAGPDLGSEAPGSIWVDRDAAGYGWFIDSTPGNDSEFGPGAVNSPAAGHVDLLSVVSHEMGHLLGFDHDAGDDVMNEALAVGVRRLPEPVTARPTGFAPIPIAVVNPMIPTSAAPPIVAPNPFTTPTGFLPLPGATATDPSFARISPRHRHVAPASPVSHGLRVRMMGAGHQGRHRIGTPLDDLALEQVQAQIRHTHLRPGE
jgi:hypothetical protein